MSMYRGFYINLERSAERRSDMEAQFVRYELQGLYERFPAADGNVLGVQNSDLTESEIGCFTSHYLLLKGHIQSVVPLHVLEDDVLFSRYTKPRIAQIIQSGAISEFDIIFTDTIVPLEPFVLGKWKQQFAKSLQRDSTGKVTHVDWTFAKHWSGAASYLVNPRSIAKLVEIYDEALRDGAKAPIDRLIRQKSDDGTLKTTCVFPFITSVRLDQIEKSTILKSFRMNRLREMALGLARQSFFVDCDLEELRRRAERMLPIPEGDVHYEVLMRALASQLALD